MSIKEVRDSRFDGGDTLYIKCECGHQVDHTVVISRQHWDYGNGVENEFYIYTNMNQYCGFFKRIGLGLKYIFNRQSIMHSETIVDEQGMREVIKWLQEGVDKSYKEGKL